MRRALLICFLIFLLSGVSASPTSQPVHSDWDQTLTRLARCVAANDPRALPSILSDNSDFLKFNGEASAPGSLLALPARRTLLYSKSYNQLPENFAGDLSESASTWKQPDEIKSLFMIGNPLSLKSANQTAQRWLMKNLSAKPTDPVGVLLFYCQETDDSESGQLLFVLAKGRGDATGIHICRLVFGDPLAE